ncbi:hypothetical protein IE53DRAFT_388762 [Violaceomyces palustris]|uniref:Uncharacterized protein n=1 Tax=Violaceomyces palustris TaxID=1673888 RepID=A0ACD0NTC2_9BASI|nr:hypothetical protein IE53DRAFT_388762 [Violaceomyces palustris]
MILQRDGPASTSASRTLLTSYPDHHPIPHSVQTRRLVQKLDKSELIHLATSWLASVRPHHLRPTLSRRSSSKTTSSSSDPRPTTSSLLDLSEERRARNLEELFFLWDVAMRDPKVAKLRAIDRLIEVDWPQGFSLGMIAEIELLHSNNRRIASGRTWVVAKFHYGHRASASSSSSSSSVDRRQARPIFSKPAFAKELGHYFQHHLYLSDDFIGLGEDEEEGVGVAGGGGGDGGGDLEAELDGDGPTSVRSGPPVGPKPGVLGPRRRALVGTHWTRNFVQLRLVLAPLPNDVYSPGLQILLVPHSPYLLVSGNLSRGPGSETREMALTALANSVGAQTVLLAQPPAGSSAAAARARGKQKAGGDDEVASQEEGEVGEGQEKVGELKGKDPLALLEILTQEQSSSGDPSSSVFMGGKGREMRSGTEGGGVVVEDGPLVAPSRRRREDDAYTLGIRLPTPPLLEDPRGRSNLEPPMVPLPPSEVKRLKRRKLESTQANLREVRELFGNQSPYDDSDLARIERVDYELDLPFPEHETYNQPRMGQEADAEPIRLRLEGSHVLAGLRTFVRSRLYRVEGEDDQAKSGGGLPSWLVDLKGTRVKVVRPSRRSA